MGQAANCQFVCNAINNAWGLSFQPVSGTATQAANCEYLLKMIDKANLGLSGVTTAHGSSIYATKQMVDTVAINDAVNRLILEPPRIFEYTGSVQLFSARQTGVYQLEVWGAQGGDDIGASHSFGGKGGYAIGNVILTSGQTVYVVVGGRGANPATTTGPVGGYNGGGRGGWANRIQYGAGGGGATHMATVTGLLSELSGNRSSILIVAGAGGGGDGNGRSGGSGGGESGTAPSGVANSGRIRPGTQTTGAAFGQGGHAGEMNGGGGGGWFGGTAGDTHDGGGGGSGYIGGVANGSMLTGVREGNGMAKITYIGA